MLNPVKDQTLTPAQAELLTRTMLAVATIDGLSDAESALIRQFYESVWSGEMKSTEAVMGGLVSQPYSVNELAGASADFAETVVLMSLMAAYADGKLSEAEREMIRKVASVLGISDEQLASHLARVQNDLIGALSHLPDSESVAAVYKELG